ncbi:MAG: sugar ABC transporter substrate-binding protein [Candidatus Sericytochromatia bacterium]|nr:sugar ABC transporter substrate-binding protein [Candidatus Sericytochromatia bacterium]
MAIRPFVPFWRLCSVLTLALGLSACAAKKTGVPTLKFATWFGTTEAKQMQAIISRINLRHTGEFQVEMMTIPGDYPTKIDTMMAGKLAPDLFLLSHEYLPSYAAIGALADLDSAIRSDPKIDLADYYPAAQDTSQWNGHYYGLPFVMMPIVLYYNKTLFDKADVPYPDGTMTWATFRDTARKLTWKEASGRTVQWGFLQYTWPPLPIWIWQNGGDVLDTTRSHPTFDDPKTVEALTFVQDLVVTDKVSPASGTVSQMGADELFKSGRIAMFFGGASDDKDQIPGMPVGTTVLPKGRQRATFAWMGHLVVSSQSKHQALAYTAWRDMLDEFHRWKIVPPRRSLAKRLDEFAPKKAYAKETILASMEYAHGIRGVVEQTDWDTFVLSTLIQPLLTGQVPAAQAAANTQAKLQRVLAVTP